MVSTCDQLQRYLCNDKCPPPSFPPSLPPSLPPIFPSFPLPKEWAGWEKEATGDMKKVKQDPLLKTLLGCRCATQREGGYDNMEFQYVHKHW